MIDFTKEYIGYIESYYERLLKCKRPFMIGKKIYYLTEDEIKRLKSEKRGVR